MVPFWVIWSSVFGHLVHNFWSSVFGPGHLVPGHLVSGHLVPSHLVPGSGHLVPSLGHLVPYFWSSGPRFLVIWSPVFGHLVPNFWSSGSGHLVIFWSLSYRLFGHLVICLCMLNYSLFPVLCFSACV